MMHRKLRCLIACEMSGRVRDAFAARGWESWSADLLPSETPVFVFQNVQLQQEGSALVIKRNGIPLLWASWPWQVIFT